jgi:glycosyltransferase involved in cell wall biosynthesis
MLADTIADLAANPGRCREMGERARQAFATEFDMPAAMEQWENLLCEISARAAHNGAALAQAPLSHA